MATQLFRSKSCGIARSSGMDSSPSTPSLYLTDDEEEQDEDEYTPISTPFMVPGWGESSGRDQQHQNQFPFLEIVVATLKKSLITCSVETEDICSVDIGWPTDVRHVSHVTFDRFNGFLGLPVEFEPDLPRKVPSASVSVFGVSPISMHCSYDYRGNSVPVILLMMQRRLYSGGGLQAEGIFRINAENSQEEYVRDQLNKGIVPHGIDVHCLAGLIKAWFRELPSGVLDSLTPEQVMHCNTEEECTQLVRMLQPTEAALLDWAIDLMTDVVQQEHHNKMNARNIAMVFAPNMTQMADPLTALIHAVQVMNFLKTLIVKTLREREESPSSRLNQVGDFGSRKKIIDVCAHKEEPILDNYDSDPTKDRPETDLDERLWSIDKKRENDEEHKPISKNTTPVNCDMGTTDNVYRGGYNSGEGEGLLDKFSLRKGVKKLCRHPVFQFSKPIKKSRNLGFVNPREGGGEAWA